MKTKNMKHAEKYGDFAEMSDKKLIKLHEKLAEEIEAILGEDKVKLYSLLECERELTLRETC
jgi:hypothetical protein